MKTGWLTKFRDDRGVAAVEFAVVFPLFMILLLFILEYARQQFVMTLVERLAVQASFAARGAENPAFVSTESVKDLFESLPNWVYDKSNPNSLIIETIHAENLHELITNPNTTGFGEKGETVCLRVTLKSKIIGWIPSEISPRTERTVTNCYVNGLAMPWIKETEIQSE